MLARLAVGIAIWLMPVTAQAAVDELLKPLAVRNLNPFIGVFGVPAFEAASVTPLGKSSLHLTLDTVSHFTRAATRSESVVIDGETYRLALRYSRGLEHRWEVGAEVPFIAHSGGFMDGLINEWHQTLGLPTLGRDRVPNNRLHFAYIHDDRLRVNVTNGTGGLGDILVFAGKTLARRDDRVFTVRGQLKLPTGDPSRLLGSGGTDLSLEATFGRNLGDRVFGAVRIGGAYLGNGDVLPELQKHWVGFGGLYVGWRPWHSLAVKLQLDVQTSIYGGSDLDQLKDPAAQLSVGASLRLGDSTFLDLGVTEDEINPDVTSDVGFQLRLRSWH